MTALYVIIDPDHCDGRDPVWVAEQALTGGARALQLRAKSLGDGARYTLARALAVRCQQHGVPFWINDRADLALLTGAAGLHLGQDDLPLVAARHLLGAQVRLGLSTHSVAEAIAAEADGADVIGFGPVFGTATKANAAATVGLEALTQAREAVRIPVVAIGGITLDNAASVARTGAHFAAVISAISLAASPHAAARALCGALSATSL